MVSLTEKAKERLRFFLQEKNPNEWRVRIRTQGPDQFGFSLEEAVPPSPMDRLMEVDGFHLMFTEILMDLLAGATVDYIETEWSRGFKVLLEKKHEAPPQPAFAPLALELRRAGRRRRRRRTIC
jgi:Fe-S cluster assembly iron-binding protein IscA